MRDFPVISNEEMQKFKELIEEEEKRRKVEKDFSLDGFAERTKLLLDLNKSYGSVEAYAVVFVKHLKAEMTRQKTNYLFFSWNMMIKYLTDVCLTYDQRGNVNLKKSFREHLKDRGFACHIDNKYNTFKVSKC